MQGPALAAAAAGRPRAHVGVAFETSHWEKGNAYSDSSQRVGFMNPRNGNVHTKVTLWQKMKNTTLVPIACAAAT
jgi:hypothetical protein